MLSHDKRTNKNGQRLLDLANEKSLLITNTTFEKRIGKRWTFLRPKRKSISVGLYSSKLPVEEFHLEY